jgi:hypothetical protein
MAATAILMKAVAFVDELAEKQ